MSGVCFVQQENHKKQRIKLRSILKVCVLAENGLFKKACARLTETSHDAPWPASHRSTRAVLKATVVRITMCVFETERDREISLVFLHQLEFLRSTTVELLGILAHGLFHNILQRLPGHKQPHNVLFLLRQSFPCLVVRDHGHVPAVHLVRGGTMLLRRDTVQPEERHG